MNFQKVPPILATALVALLAACAKPAAEVPEPSTPVRVAESWSGPTSPALETNGVVGTKDEFRLSFKVAGVIREITVEEGQLVKKGQRLAQIELAEVNAQVEQANQLADKARRDLERGERLYADQVISLEQLQDLRTQARVAEAQSSSARFNLGYSVITAPLDGVVLRKLAQERELVPAGQPVLIVGAENRGYIVRAALADREIVQTQIGDRAEIRLDAYPDRVFTGKVSEVASAADERTRLFPIEVRFDEPPGRLASGLVAKVSIVPATSLKSTLVYVPVAAVVEGDGQKADVFVVADDHAVRRPVRVAFITQHGVALAEGLASGETVVTDGALYLADGERITIVAEAAQAIGGVPLPSSSG